LAGSRTTLRDVAKLANVHYATASTVLNGSKGSTSVSEATAKRVMQAARDLDYKVNRSAQQLRTQRSSIVGLLTGDLENPFFAHMVSACSASLEAAGYDIVLASRRRDEYGDSHLRQSLLSRDLAGVLVWSETRTEVRERIAASGIANVVVLGMTIPGYDCVAGLMDPGLVAAFDHLHDEGWRRIAYFSPSHLLVRDGDVRYRTYQNKMAEFGQQEIVIAYPGSVSDVGAAFAAAEAIAKQPAADRPDAIFCFNDMNAIGAMMGLRRAGLRVPDDIALVGFDNLRLSAQLDVPLTTVDYPLDAICRSATDMLLRRMAADPHDAAKPHTEHLTTSLIVRESSRRR
jgi:LacI family transcriptional regulator